MATVIARSIASTPKRTATETWGAIVSILAPDTKSAAHTELQKVAGVAASSIASEAPNDDAFIIYGRGPQIRIYCVFGEDAVSGEGVNEDSIQECPTDGDWRMSMPCHAEDLDWTQKRLKSLSSRVTARALGEKINSDEAESSRASAGLSLSLNEFLKP
jgi:hypothetical protein